MVSIHIFAICIYRYCKYQFSNPFTVVCSIRNVDLIEFIRSVGSSTHYDVIHTSTGLLSKNGWISCCHFWPYTIVSSSGIDSHLYSNSIFDDWREFSRPFQTPFSRCPFWWIHGSPGWWMLCFSLHFYAHCWCFGCAFIMGCVKMNGNFSHFIFQNW